MLADAGLVIAERQGRQRLYRIDPAGVARLQAEIASFWTHELDELVRDAHHVADRDHVTTAPTAPPEERS